MSFRQSGFRFVATVSIAISSFALLAGCGGDTSSDDGSGLKGSVTVDGSSTVGPISVAVATEFQKLYPDVKVGVGMTGTGSGFKKFNRGESDISDASRPIKLEEFQACKENGINFIELPVAYDGLTIVIHPDNDWASQLTIDDLRSIFRSDLAAKTWKDVNPEWPEEQIELYSPGTQSGTFDYFMEVLLTKEDEDNNIGIRQDMNTSEDDNQLVTGVSGSKNAIGFFGVAYYVENKDRLQAVAIVNPDTNEAVLPESDAIESGKYSPFSRPLFIYANVESTKRPEVKEFLEHYLTHAAEMAESKKYVALPSSIYERARKIYDESKTGTHFLTPTGESRHGSIVDIYTDENLVSFEEMTAE